MITECPTCGCTIYAPGVNLTAAHPNLSDCLRALQVEHSLWIQRYIRVAQAVERKAKSISRLENANDPTKPNS